MILKVKMKMANGFPDWVAPLIGILLIITTSLAVYPGSIVPLSVYEPLLLLILAFFGIQMYVQLRLAGKGIKDLLPGIVSDKVIIGIIALIMITWLFISAAMPENNYYTFVTLIIGNIVMSYIAVSAAKS